MWTLFIKEATEAFYQMTFVAIGALRVKISEFQGFVYIYIYRSTMIFITYTNIPKYNCIYMLIYCLMYAWPQCMCCAFKDYFRSTVTQFLEH